MLFWAILAIVFFIIEITIPGAFFTLFFMLSAFAMIFFERYFDNIYLELGIFSVVSIILTFILRPMLIKHFGINKVVKNSNLDAFLEKTGIVIEDINEKSTGKVQVDFEKWTAKTEDGSFIAKDSRVNLLRIDGNILYVEKIKSEE